jgi:hypothetical protein
MTWRIAARWALTNSPTTSRVDGMENQIRVMEHLADRVLPTAAQLG